MKFVPRSVPWSCRDEWMQVYKNLKDFADLFPASIVDTQMSTLISSMAFVPLSLPDRKETPTLLNIKSAVRRIELWHIRGRNPIAVESTATLLSALIHDIESTSASTEIRLSYAMALVRFINGMADQCQKASYALPIAYLVESLGINGTLVDVRHAATHDTMPSLQLLRDAAREALVWVFDKYWAPESVDMVEFTDDQGNVDEYAQQNIYDSLDFYKTSRKVELKSGLDDSVALKVLESTMTIDWDSRITRHTVIKKLMTLGMLVPINKKKRVLVSTKKMPVELLKLWSPALERFDSIWPHSFYTELLSACNMHIKTQQSAQDASSSALVTLAAWAAFCVQKITEDSDVNETIKEVLMEPHKYTGMVLANAVNVYARMVHNDTDLIRQIRTVIEVAEQFSVTDVIEISGQSNDLETLTKRYEALEAPPKDVPIKRRRLVTEHDANESLEHGVWRKLKDSEWNMGVPIGTIPENLAVSKGYSLVAFPRWDHNVNLQDHNRFGIPSHLLSLM